MRIGTVSRIACVALARAGGGEQALGVLVFGCADDLLGGAQLTHRAIAQYQDMVGHLCHHGQIMADVDGGGVAFADGMSKGAQHFDLGCHVQRRRWFIQDDQIRVGDQSHRRHQALQLPAGDLVRIARTNVFRIGQAQGVE